MFAVAFNRKGRRAGMPNVRRRQSRTPDIQSARWFAIFQVFDFIT